MKIVVEFEFVSAEQNLAAGAGTQSGSAPGFCLGTVLVFLFCHVDERNMLIQELFNLFDTIQQPGQSRPFR